MITIIKDAITTGTSEDLTVIKDDNTGHLAHSFQVIHTGSPSALTIEIEGSIDGINYTCLATNTLTAEELANDVSIFHIINKPVSKIRGNITKLEGGVSPTVSVYYLKGNGSF